MSNNGIPPLNDWQSDNYPVIYDEGNETQYYVKTGNKIEIPGGGSSYLVYTALLSQSGTDAPTVVILENTIGNIVWTRSDVGAYVGTLEGAFPAAKTAVFPIGSGNGSIASAGDNTFSYATFLNRGSDDIISLVVNASNYDPVEFSTAWGSTSIVIEIRVYP